MIVVKLLAVFLLLGFTLWWIRRYDSSKLARGPQGVRPVEVLGQARLSKSSSVAIVRAGGQLLTVGVTDRQISLLSSSEVPLDDLAPAEQVALAESLLTEDAGPRPTFAEALRAQLAGRRPDGPRLPSARMPHRMHR